MTRTLVIDPGLQAYIDPLTPEEHAALERSLLAEGCRDALVLWGDVLVDGHNRHRICTAHGLPYETVQNPRFRTIEDVHLWMIDQHLGRRSVSDFQRGVLALRQREIVAARQAQPVAPESGAPPRASPDTVPDAPAGDASPAPLATREAVARAARLSSGQMVMIEKIQKQAAPEVVAAVKSGALSINAAAAVSSLPAEEQVAAATAGADELKRAAKRVREARRKPVADSAAAPDAADPSDGGALPDEMQSLRRRVAELTAENAMLRQQLAQRH